MNSPSFISFTLPFSITIVLVLSCSPGLPSWTTFSSPGSKESSYSIIVSKGISFFSVKSWVPSGVPLPTWIRASSGSTLSTLGLPTTWESLIVHVVVIVPTLPGFTILYSPGLSSSDSSTWYLNGISSTCLTSPSVESSPTSMISLTGAFVSFGLEIFVTFEFSIVIVYSSSPSTPFWTTLYSPFLSSGFTLTSTSNGFLLV